MKTDITKFNPTEFEIGLADIAQAAPPRVGFLKMDKTGEWSYGEGTEVDASEAVYIDPLGFVRGWQCWADTDIPGVQANLLGSEWAPMGKPAPEQPSHVPETGRGWDAALGISLLIDGQKLTYTTNSVGGRNAVAKLAEAIAIQYRKDKAKFIPVVSLGNDSYKHKKYGKIYVPIFAIQNWVSELPEEAMAPVLVEAPANSKKAAPKKTVKAASKRV